MRVSNEIQTSIQNEVFAITATNRGAQLREIMLNGTRISRDLTSNHTEPGTKAALFCAPQIFARIINRKAFFRGTEYSFPYPEDIDPEAVDPDRIYIHGIGNYYTWEIAELGDTRVTYELCAARLPADYPFPHTSFVTYDLSGGALTITVGVKDCAKDTPAMLTVHPFFAFSIDGATPEIQAHLSHKFEYDTSSSQPMSTEGPVEHFSEMRFSEFTRLPKDLDHSFLSTDGISRLRWGAICTLQMEDITSADTTSYKPLQIWTTGAESRKAFGVEQGGPANLLYLVENGKVSNDLLPVVEPGQTKSRVVRYTAHE